MSEIKTRALEEANKELNNVDDNDFIDLDSIKQMALYEVRFYVFIQEIQR